jgi:hypothetical protein
LHSITEFASHLVIEPNDAGALKHGMIISIPSTFTGSDLMFYSGGRASTNKKLTLFNGGNLLLQNGGTHTDSGERLQVTGTMKVTSDANINGILYLSTSRTMIFNGGTGTIAGDFNGQIYIRSNATTLASSDGIYRFENISNLNATSGTQIYANMKTSFLPTSGTATFTGLNLNYTINQIGGANGITRGLYVNPTLTSAADFRAIETTNGKIIFGNLPTSSAGLPTGAIWNDAGTIKIV